MKAVNSRRGAVLGTVLAVLAVGIGATVLGQSSHRAPPAVLRLATTTAPRADAALGTAGQAGSDYQLVGTLPAGHPPDTPAYTLSSRATATTVGRLAAALHAGTPVRDGAGWRAGGLAGGLVVNADGSWWWSQCADATVSSDGVASGCATVNPATGTGGGTASSGPGVATGAPGSSAVPIPPVSATPPAFGPSPAATTGPDTVRTAAAPVLAAVGLDPADARVEASTALVDPVVGGLPTYGLSTRVAVAADGTVTDAGGWLATTARGDPYPLLTAQQAFDALPPLPRMLLACPITPGGKGCLAPQPVPVSGAHLGLALRTLREGAPVLVPAWLFEVRGSTEVVAGLAVEPAYLDDGSTPPTPTTGPSTEPSAVPPASGPAEPPGTPTSAARTGISPGQTLRPS